MTKMQIVNKYGTYTVEIKGDELDVHQMFDLWKGVMAAATYHIHKFELTEKNR